MGTVVHSIGIGGTHDYTSLQAWADAMPANLVTNGNAQRAELYFNGPGDGEFLGTSGTLLELTGHTTDATNNITITTGPGQSFRDNAGVRTNPLRYDATKGVALRVNVSYSYIIKLTDNNVTIENLQIMQDGGNSIPIASNSGFGGFVAQFNNCLIHNHSGVACTAVYLFASFDNAIFRNCVIILDTQTGSGGAGVVTGRGGEYYFCTFVVPSGSAVTGATATVSAYGGGLPSVVKNCAIFGFSALYDPARQIPTYTNCATDLASPPSGVTGSLTYAGQFVGSTSTAQDWRTTSGTALRSAAGAADTINGAFDISGLPRPQGGLWDIGAWSRAFSTVTHSIGIGGTHDYTSMAAWAAALPANLVGDASAQRAELYFNGAGDGEFVTASGNILTLSGHTTDPTHTITLTTGPGQSFRDHASVRTNALTYNASYGVGIRTTGPNYQTTLIIGDDNVFLSNLQVCNVVYSSSVLSHTGTGNLIADNCIFSGVSANLNANLGSTSTWNNCLFEHIGAFGVSVVVVNRGTNHFNFCTFVRASDISATDTVTVSYETSYFTNCALFGGTNAIGMYAGTIISTNCATNDTTPPSGFTGSLTFTDQFEGTTSTAPDWRLKTGSALINTGAVVPGALDITGVARPQGAGYDIGVWEAGFIVGSPPQALAPVLYTDIMMRPNLIRIV